LCNIMQKATNDVNNKRRDAYISREFDRAAKSYDESRLVRSYQRRVQILVINSITIEKGMNVLDLGCGTGHGSIDVASKMEGTGNVIGIDLSERMIEQAKVKLADFKYNNIKFLTGSAISLDYQNYFDCVFSTNAFHHFEKKEMIFQKVWQSLKRNGIFIVQDICDDYFLMKIVDLAGKIGEKAHVGSTTSEELRNLFSTTGFAHVKMEKVKFNWFWGIMIGKGIKQSR
jgi:cyclopropane fatty-acyl-phospholipid synthase-like methyltransferase